MRNSRMKEIGTNGYGLMELSDLDQDNARAYIACKLSVWLGET